MSDEMDELKRSIWPHLFPRVESVALDLELQAALREAEGKMVLQHKLIEDVNYAPSKNASYNLQVSKRRELVSELKDRQAWLQYIQAHSANFRADVLLEDKNLMSTNDWCSVAEGAWYNLPDATAWRKLKAWTQVFCERNLIVGIAAGKHAADFEQQSNPLPVYRGCDRNYPDGLSWSLSPKVAEDFCRRAGPTGVVICAKVTKEHVLAYISPNGEEFEIIARPGHVFARRIEQPFLH